MIIRRLIVPLAVAVVTAHAGQGFAQGAFPAPLPGQAGTANDPAFPPVPGQPAAANDPAFPPVNGSPPANDPAFPPVALAPRTRSFPVNGAAPLAGGGFERPRRRRRRRAGRRR